MNNKRFQYHLAKAILHSTEGLEYDDAVAIVRMVAPEIERVIIQREQQKLAEQKLTKQPASLLKLNYVRVI